jgi:hypothetical protein
VRVQSNGVITQQTLPVVDFSVVNLKDALVITLLPVDKNLPASNATLNITFRPLSASSFETDKEERVDAAAIVQRQQFTFVNFLGGGAKNVVAGGIGIKSIKGPLLTLNGTLHVRGKLTSDPPGQHFPAKIRILIKHKAPNNSVLSTDTFDVTVQTNGAILLQNFPFKSVNTAGIRESLEFFVTPLNTDFPDCTANLTAWFTALPGT